MWYLKNNIYVKLLLQTVKSYVGDMLRQCFSTELPPKEPLSMSRDIFHGKNLGVGLGTRKCANSI